MSIRSSVNTVRIHISMDERVFDVAQTLKEVFGCETNSELVSQLIATEALKQGVQIGERHERENKTTGRR